MLFYFYKSFYWHSISYGWYPSVLQPIHTLSRKFYNGHHNQYSNILLYFIMRYSNWHTWFLTAISIRLLCNQINKIVIKETCEILTWGHGKVWWRWKGISMKVHIHSTGSSFTSPTLMVSYAFLFLLTSGLLSSFGNIFTFIWISFIWSINFTIIRESFTLFGVNIESIVVNSLFYNGFIVTLVRNVTIIKICNSIGNSNLLLVVMGAIIESFYWNHIVFYLNSANKNTLLGKY